MAKSKKGYHIRETDVSVQIWLADFFIIRSPKDGTNQTAVTPRLRKLVRLANKALNDGSKKRSRP